MNECGVLRRVALKHARDAFRSQAACDAQWRALNFLDAPDFRAALREYDAFAEIVTSHGAEAVWLPADDRVGMDSLYVRDAALVSPRGVIACAMGKPLRATEPAVEAAVLTAAGCATAGAIVAPGQVEGGDVVWFDAQTMAVGRGYRTNEAGIAQVAALVGADVRVQTVPLPHYKGPSDVFHLMSILSPVDVDLAVAYSPLMPVPFREWLLDRGVKLVEVPDDEFDSMGANVLALAPRLCVMVAGNPRTRRALEAAGATVLEYEGRHISRLGGGGPTCLTRPLVRA